MLFSVVIPTCDRPASLAACLARLAPGRQTLAAEHYEVIVSDDGAAAPAEALVRETFPWARWTPGPRRGPAANRNAGAAAARGAWLVFTDDDCLPDPGWLAAYARAAEAVPPPALLEGRTYVDRPRTHPLDTSPVNETGGYLWSCNFAIGRGLFAELRGFDERFPFSALEDRELHLRLRRRGIEPVFCPAAGVLHPWRLVADLRRHRARHVQSQLLLESIHPGQGFPYAWTRILRTHLRTAVCEHLPWFFRRPWVALRSIPPLWATMAADVARTARWRSRARRAAAARKRGGA